MNRKGFSVIELVVCVSVLSIILAILLPQYVRASSSAREEEVKSNIHTIQTALERYATDHEGHYPQFLIGAERDSNIITSSVDLAGNGFSRFPAHGITPFPMTVVFHLEPLSISHFEPAMDPLIKQGYLAEFPVNPFAYPSGGLWHASPAATGSEGVFPYGGQRGDKMFDLGFGWGDTPQTDFLLTMAEMGGDSAPDLDAPGNFYYHPIFEDLIPVYIHYSYELARLYSGPDPRDVVTPSWSGNVTGYFLYGYGGPGLRGNQDPGGLDYFNRMPADHGISETTLEAANFMPFDVADSSTNMGQQQSVETTGYPAQEYDPWTFAFPDGFDPVNPDEMANVSGPDGVPDWVIIEVSSGTEVYDGYAVFPRDWYETGW